METLRFTSGAIRAIENERKAPVTDVIVDFSYSTLALFVKKGLFLKTDEEADEAIEKYLEETNEKGEKANDIFTLYVKIQDSLKKAGFLSRALPTEQYMKGLTETMDRSKEMAESFSQPTGNEEKKTQSTSE